MSEQPSVTHSDSRTGWVLLPDTDLTALPWRTGRKVGRTIYVQPGEQPTDQDPLVGVMDTRELAAEAVSAHNLALALRNSGAR